MPKAVESLQLDRFCWCHHRPDPGSTVFAKKAWEVEGMRISLRALTWDGLFCFSQVLLVRIFLTLGIAATWLGSSTTSAQDFSRSAAQRRHYLLDSKSPPGFVARAQIAGQRPGVGSFTAVSMKGPAGLRIGLAQAGQFLPPIESPVTTGMLVGAVYRFHVTHIPGYPGEELYPTLEIVDRVFPEHGREHRFPIPILLTEEDLNVALQGGLVTRVIYLEDSEVAEPVARTPWQHSTIEASAQENALRIADQVGRPLAILRIGSRVPANDSADLTEFLFGCPPWVPLPVAPDVDALKQDGHLPEYVLPQRTNPLYSEDTIESVPRIP